MLLPPLPACQGGPPRRQKDATNSHSGLFPTTFSRGLLGPEGICLHFVQRVQRAIDAPSPHIVQQNNHTTTQTMLLSSHSKITSPSRAKHTTAALPALHPRLIGRPALPSRVQRHACIAAALQTSHNSKPGAAAPEAAPKQAPVASSLQEKVSNFIRSTAKAAAILSVAVALVSGTRQPHTSHATSPSLPSYSLPCMHFREVPLTLGVPAIPHVHAGARQRQPSPGRPQCWACRWVLRTRALRPQLWRWWWRLLRRQQGLLWWLLEPLLQRLLNIQVCWQRNVTDLCLAAVCGYPPASRVAVNTMSHNYSLLCPPLITCCRVSPTSPLQGAHHCAQPTHHGPHTHVPRHRHDGGAWCSSGDSRP